MRALTQFSSALILAATSCGQPADRGNDTDSRTQVCVVGDSLAEAGGWQQKLDEARFQTRTVAVPGTVSGNWTPGGKFWKDVVECVSHHGDDVVTLNVGSNDRDPWHVRPAQVFKNVLLAVRELDRLGVKTIVLFPVHPYWEAISEVCNRVPNTRCVDQANLVPVDLRHYDVIGPTFRGDHQVGLHPQEPGKIILADAVAKILSP